MSIDVIDPTGVWNDTLKGLVSHNELPWIYFELHHNITSAMTMTLKLKYLEQKNCKIMQMTEDLKSSKSKNIQEKTLYRQHTGKT